MMAIESKLFGFACAAFACLFWGTSFVAGKIAISEIGIYNTIFARLLISSAIFLYVVFKNQWIPDKEDWLLFIITAFLTLPVTFILQFYGLSKTSASHASIMIGMEPVLITIASFIFTKTKISIRNLIAALLACGGVSLIAVQNDKGASLEGDLIVLFSTMIVAAWVLLSKKLMNKYPPLFFSAYITLLGLFTFFPIWLTQEKTPVALTANAMLAILFLSIFCTVFAQVLWNFGLRKIQPHEAGILLSLEPLSGVALGVLLLSEPFHMTLMVGGLLITTAVWLNSKKFNPIC